VSEHGSHLFVIGPRPLPHGSGPEMNTFAFPKLVADNLNRHRACSATRNPHSASRP
jgi:hypothetical protein